MTVFQRKALKVFNNRFPDQQKLWKETNIEKFDIIGYTILWENAIYFGEQDQFCAKSKSDGNDHVFLWFFSEIKLIKPFEHDPKLRNQICLMTSENTAVTNSIVDWE